MAIFQGVRSSALGDGGSLESSLKFRGEEDAIRKGTIPIDGGTLTQWALSSNSTNCTRPSSPSDSLSNLAPPTLSACQCINNRVQFALFPVLVQTQSQGDSTSASDTLPEGDSTNASIYLRTPVETLSNLLSASPRSHSLLMLEQAAAHINRLTASESQFNFYAYSRLSIIPISITSITPLPCICRHNQSSSIRLTMDVCPSTPKSILGSQLLVRRRNFCASMRSSEMPLIRLRAARP
ncbi:hypothetical protein BJ322DRAFT_1219646 [Thelephora terrestris]|uniref:Uncharacterized protein n=1 Tax=Thelephora terrestris TaxID=56493 RepID=A0A9P6HB69_9AGAM|nr:hypothetical protein BJ322DRAFT_1219646 [Thelephora terrestris]